MRTALYLGAAFVVAVLTAVFWTPITDALAPKTTGDIFVSGPQIYTRERLVNDRYREDAWLLSELNKAPDQKFGLTMSTSVTRSDSVAVTAAATTAKPPATPTATEAPPAPADTAKPTLTPTVSIDISPQDRLNALRAYREQIRTLMIENQLDDRHDLRGNSLYRLSFDATVLPGANTQTGARITVTILPPDDLLGQPEIVGLNDVALHDRESTLSKIDDPNDPLHLNPAQSAVWQRVYARWLDSLTRRFDDSRKAIIRAYETNQFTARQYDQLLDAAKRDARPVWLAAHARDASVAKLPSAQQPAALDKLAEAALAPSKDNAAAMNNLRKLDTDNDEVQTSDAGHAAFQYEIERLIAVVSAQPSNLIPETPSQQHPDPNCGDLQQYGSLGAPPGDNSIKYDLRYLRDRVFEPQIFNTVLGLGPNTVANSTVLAQFALGLTTYGAPGPAFTFYQQRPSFVISNVKDCFPKRGLQVNHIDDSPAFFIQSDVDSIKLALPSYDPRHDIEATVAKRWTAPTDKARIDTIFVDVGLTNFIRMAGRQLDVFSYALPPAEPDELNAIQSRNEWSRFFGAEATAASLPAQATGRLKAAEERAELSQRLATRKLVVSFGEQPNAAAARFGWVIQPQEPIDINRYRQRASQTSLTALVSLPAWWEEVKVNVATSWEGQPSRTQSRDYIIVLPVNFETIDASLFEANDRSPVIDEWAMNRLSVTPCTKTEIVIPGRRLWRSTVVTLGGQRASGITVMPDMNGIVATFDPLDFPSTWTGFSNAYKAQLMVWTSQGSAQPYWVTFKNSGQQRGCPVDKPADKPGPLSTEPARATPLKIASP